MWDFSYIEETENSSHQNYLVITRLLEQYNDEDFTGEKFRQIIDYDGDIVVFDDISDFNKKAIDHFFYKRKAKNFQRLLFITIVCWFAWRTISLNTTVTICSKQFSKKVENFDVDIAVFDVSYEGFKDLCRQAWEHEEHSYFYSERSKKKIEGICLYMYSDQRNF